MIENPQAKYAFQLKSRDYTPVLEDGQTTGQSSEPQQTEVVFHLGETFLNTYGNSKWAVKLCFGCHRAGELKMFRKIRLNPPNELVEWKTITVGKATEIVKWYDEAAHYEALYFKVLLTRQVSSDNFMISMERELKGLKEAMSQMRTTLGSFQCPSIDITRLIFHPKRGGTIKNLYVPSHILTKFEYFQSLHSQEYSETSQTDESPFPSDQLTRQDVGEVFAEDSDDEWDIDEDPREPQKSDKFKATIHVTDTSRRTYQAFIDYAFCGALYFAPLQSTYRQVKLECQIDTLPFPAWPTWAKAYSESHVIVPGYKTLTSPKSLYRMADMLLIPELKSICRRQIIRFLQDDNVVSEIMSPLFRQHEELRMSAYEYVKKNWDSIAKRGEMSRIFTNLSRKEAALIGETLFKHLTPSTTSKT
ncbi:uncharacterized protein MELLADRAFT_116687 [Melampsora larici-populina 98AG31]|uniref:BTB domain-containing protein n=1 Tax=Melampsora larici-populina (strain 98AG31 / pathotype 3-4-7) TaxID=747676 RepID=F4RP40_MELLP|nr:uncharacterized protein MELLADRAFT_116687 [Melampsora larici-populina 98AG31]EGG05919.1 hypothetical protein MELLADRAFT_116687 [Melampsora larici-populina 98AG31]